MFDYYTSFTNISLGNLIMMYCKINVKKSTGKGF